jgi:3-hydroxymyristoyl/3-hydroxydecanoyl-(acyl carrier protein) dehydratase
MITALPIAANHPAYSGHFPGHPLLPGVVLLDAALHVLERAGREASAGSARGWAGRWTINSAKFQSAVRPGEALTLEHETLPNGSVRFAIRTADRAVASGILMPSQRATERDRGEQD